MRDRCFAGSLARSRVGLLLYVIRSDALCIRYNLRYLGVLLVHLRSAFHRDMASMEKVGYLVALRGAPPRVDRYDWRKR